MPFYGRDLISYGDAEPLPAPWLKGSLLRLGNGGACPPAPPPEPGELFPGVSTARMPQTPQTGRGASEPLSRAQGLGIGAGPVFFGGKRLSKPGSPPGAWGTPCTAICPALALGSCLPGWHRPGPCSFPARSRDCCRLAPWRPDPDPGQQHFVPHPLALGQGYLWGRGHLA